METIVYGSTKMGRVEGYTRPVYGGPRLCLTMIVKNEVQSLTRTLKSFLPFVEGVVIEDTGSTDGTQQLARDLLREYGGHLKLAEVFEAKEWIDFSTNRNMAIRRAEDLGAEWILIADANEQLEGGEELSGFLALLPQTLAMLTSLVRVDPSGAQFNSCRLWRAKRGFRYRGRVHEHPYACDADGGWLFWRNPETGELEPGAESCWFGQAPEWFKIWQNRADDNFKSMARLKWDTRMLKLDLEDGFHTARTLYYLGQTYQDRGKREKALATFRRRSKEDTGFWEETVWAYLRIASLETTTEAALIAFMHAADISRACRVPMAEPLAAIADIFLGGSPNDPLTAYMWIRQACLLPVPLLLKMWWNRRLYVFGRWERLARACSLLLRDPLRFEPVFLSGIWREGLDAAMRAVAVAEDATEKASAQVTLEAFLDLCRERNRQQFTIQGPETNNQVPAPCMQADGH